MAKENPKFVFPRIVFGYANKAVVDFAPSAWVSPGINVLMGRSGSGKSTFFKLLAGLLTAEQHGPDLRELSSKVSLSFQDIDSFPWKTVRANLVLAAQQGGLAGDDAVSEVSKKVGLEAHLHLYPNQLSGGLKKRLALARVLLMRRPIVLLDEPFSSLDISARVEMWGLLRALVAAERITCILITHDLEEAVALGRAIVWCSGPPLRTVCVVENQPDELEARALARQKVLELAGADPG